MKIGVLSDTHLTDKSQELPKKMLEDFKGADLIIHAGDLVDCSVIDKLKKVCPNVIAVCGNMDPAEVRNKFPEKQIVSAGKFRIGVYHGYGAAANLVEFLSEIFRNDSVDIVIFGHSHLGLNQEKNGIIFFNPGSPTDKVYAKENTYGIIELNNKIELKLVKL
ncbi:MAG: metallophosphoesterase family protein [Candidatus Omnitrophota bacterium]|jgi:putative phosphoesterase